MVEDPKVQHLIHWTSTGSFLVANADEFAKEVLPQYFKHNNFASFVRQLNMYGFHKVNDFVQQNSEQNWEFSHPMFKKGNKDSLFEIKRKVPTKGMIKLKHDKESQQIMDGVNDRIERLEGQIVQLQEAYTTSTNELTSCRQLIKEQRVAINQIIQYLGPNTSPPEEG